MPVQGTWLNTVSSKQGHDLLLLKHGIFCFCASESWLTFNLSIKFPSDMRNLSMLISPTQKSGYICDVFFRSSLFCMTFPTPFFIFSFSMLEGKKLFLTMPEALSFVLHSVSPGQQIPCAGQIPLETLCCLWAGTERSRGSTAQAQGSD